MTDSRQEIEALLLRIREGSQDAVKELLDRYGEALLRVIRRRLARPLRKHFDSADFAQAVWASFFAVPVERYQFRSPEELMTFLTHVARNKLRDAARREFRARKRDVTRTHSLDGSAAVAANLAPSRQPTPSQVVLAEDQWDRLLEGQPEYSQSILRLLREGHTHEEVAAQLGLNEKTVRRVVERALHRLAARASS
jgi:RNA polymerase sigma-70 factor (ECF subfamily)